MKTTRSHKSLRHMYFKNRIHQLNKMRFVNHLRSFADAFECALPWVLAASLAIYLLVLYGHLGIFIYGRLAASAHGESGTLLPSIVRFPDMFLSLVGVLGIIYAVFQIARSYPWGVSAVLVLLVLDGFGALLVTYGQPGANLALDVIPLLRFSGLLGIVYLVRKLTRAFTWISPLLTMFLLAGFIYWDYSVSDSSFVRSALDDFPALPLLVVLFALLGGALHLFSSFPSGAVLLGKVCAFRRYPKLCLIALPFLIYLAFPPYFCLKQSRFIGDEEFIEKAIWHEFGPEGTAEIDGSAESIRSYLTHHPDCCKVWKRRVLLDKLFYKGEFSQVVVTLNDKTFVPISPCGVVYGKK